MADEIVVATTDGDFEAFGRLIREYWDWLHARYAHLPGFIDAVGGHQALDAELNALPETSLGFKECLAYHEYPTDLMTHLRFLERPLVQRSEEHVTAPRHP